MTPCRVNESKTVVAIIIDLIGLKNCSAQSKTVVSKSIQLYIAQIYIFGFTKNELFNFLIFNFNFKKFKKTIKIKHDKIIN